jgi:hypothetical protein
MKKQILFLITLLSLSIHGSLADIDFNEVKKNFSQSQLAFAPGTVGAVIVGGGDHLYTLKVKKGQNINLFMNSGGMRAAVYLVSPNKKELGYIYDNEEHKNFDYEVKETGTYYLVCYSGPTFHTYDFTVRVDF